MKNVIITLFLLSFPAISADFLGVRKSPGRSYSDPGKYTHNTRSEERRCAFFDEQALITLAEDEGYGYKYANLRLLKTFVDLFNTSLSAELPRVNIPNFLGVSNKEVIRALDGVGFDIQKHWDAILGKLDSETRLQIFQTKTIPEAFWAEQQKFTTELEDAFDRLDATNPFQLDENKLSELYHLFALASKDKDPLMVRSSGKEDTKNFANAGGNESVANVDATMNAIKVAAKKVVVSYFGKKSLQQRLGLGDTTLFNPGVFVPFFIQKMIGEQNNSEIPSCGVMFSEEPEGGISMHEKGRATGITLVQAAWGHNEGVVNSKVSVDTYVMQNVDEKPVIYPTIQAKRERLKPGKNGLITVKNKSQIIYKPALELATLTTLKKLADRLERFYNYPVDVEFVVRDNIVWLVQARPLVHNQLLRERRPSFIKNLHELKQQNMVLKGKTIVGFGGQVAEITDSKSVVIEPNIKKALDEYLYKRKRDEIKVIISGSIAPSTSHEATVFRNEGKVVIYVEDFEACKKALTHLGKDEKIIVSPQQHSIIKPDTKPIDDDEKMVVPRVTEGWAMYPLPQELSVVASLYGSQRPIYDPRIRDVHGKTSFRKLLDQMKEWDSDDRENSINAALALPQFLRLWFAKQSQEVAGDIDLKTQMIDIIQAADVLCSQIAWLHRQNASRITILT